MYPVKNKDGQTDYRYSVTIERCGYTNPQFVVRYCDEWLDRFETKQEAFNYAIEHNKNRLEKL